MECPHPPLTLHTSPRPSSSTPDPLYPSQTSHTHPRLCRSVPVPSPPHKVLHTNPNPFPHILFPLYLSKPSMSRPFTPISGTLHTTKAVHTHTKPSIPILGTHTIPWPFTPTLDHPDQFQNPHHTKTNPFTPI